MRQKSAKGNISDRYNDQINDTPSQNRLEEIAEYGEQSQGRISSSANSPNDKKKDNQPTSLSSEKFEMVKAVRQFNAEINTRQLRTVSSTSGLNHSGMGMIQG